MKSRFLELIADFKNDIEILNATYVWPFSASIGWVSMLTNFSSIYFVSTYVYLLCSQLRNKLEINKQNK